MAKRQKTTNNPKKPLSQYAIPINLEKGGKKQSQSPKKTSVSSKKLTGCSLDR